MKLAVIGTALLGVRLGPGLADGLCRPVRPGAQRPGAAGEPESQQADYEAVLPLASQFDSAAVGGRERGALGAASARGEGWRTATVVAAGGL